MIFNQQYRLVKCISSNDFRMIGPSVVVLLCGIHNIAATDEDFEKSVSSIQDHLQSIGTAVSEKNEQIKQLQMALLKSQLKEEAVKGEFENFTAVVDKNVRLEKAVLSLKDVINENSEKIVELESKVQSCVAESQQKDKKIRSLDFELSRDKMYKKFFESVVSQLKNFNNSAINFDISVGRAGVKK